MERRTLLVAGLVLPLAGRVRGADSAKTRHIAWVSAGDAESQFESFRRTLAERGYADGRTLVLSVSKLDLQASNAKEVVDRLIAKGVELIVAQGPVVPPVHRAVGQRVPVAIAFSGDPVAAGMAESLRRPGRRTTGVSFLVLELCGKRLELLKEIAPGAERVAILLNSRHYGYQAELDETVKASTALGCTTEAFDAGSPEAFARAFDAISRKQVHGVVVFPDATMTRMAGDIAAFGIRARLPIVAGWTSIARRGVLASYGPDLDEAYDRLAHQVIRLLEGGDASAMPIERPTRIRIAVNLKAAAALGITLPPALVARADDVIQ